MRKANSSTKPTTIDEYLAAIDVDKRAALQNLRKSIRAAVPKVEECITYGLPAFRLNGRFLVAFGAAANHCAFYPGSPLQKFKLEFKNYDTSKGTIRFQPDKPIPSKLIKALVKARIEASGSSNIKKQKKRKGGM